METACMDTGYHVGRQIKEDSMHTGYHLGRHIQEDSMHWLQDIT